MWGSTPSCQCNKSSTIFGYMLGPLILGDSHKGSYEILIQEPLALIVRGQRGPGSSEGQHRY